MCLTIENNLADPDAFYETLLATYRGLSPDEAQRVSAKLILLLANHVGDMVVLRDAMARARAGVRADSGGGEA